MKNKKVSTRFRKLLTEQLPILQNEGLISPDQTQAISQRYKLDDLRTESTRMLLMVIYTIGVSLIAIGIISFIAAHWTGIPRQLKVALILTAMIAAHLTGFYLWKISAKSPTLGHALTILGTLIFGAALGLMAQIFHVETRWNSLFATWALGAVIMALALQSTPQIVIAIITSFIWFCGRIDWGQNTYWFYPLLAAAVFLPWAYWKKSPLTFFLALLSVGLSTIICTIDTHAEELLTPAAVFIVGTMYFCWGALTAGTEKYKHFDTIPMILGFTAVAFVTYLCSFRDFAEELAADLPLFTSAMLLQSTAAIIAAIALLVMLAPAAMRIRNNPGLIKIGAAILFSTVIFFAGCLSGDQWVIIFGTNTALVLLAASLICAAADCRDRRLFWTGVFIVSIMIISRTIEYETGLMIKAAAFSTGGVAVIIAGVIFEKYLKKRKITDA